MDTNEHTRLARWIVELDPATLEVRRHGNGFLQVDLPGGTFRLHIWNPELPAAQKVPTPIHDHRFSFHSVVLYGCQHHWGYSVYYPDRADPTHEVYEAQTRHDEDTVLVKTGALVRAEGPYKHAIPAGQMYALEAGAFHETPIIEYTITVMVKRNVLSGYIPRVLCPIGMEPDNDYDRYSFSAEDGREQLVLAQATLRGTL